MNIRRTASLAAAAVMTVSILAAPLAAIAEGYPFNTTCSYYYDRLDSSARQLYDNLLISARIVDESSDVYIEAPPSSYTGLSSGQVDDIVWIFVYDHPEYFWIANQYSTQTSSWYGNSVILDVYEAYQDGAKRQKARQELIDTAQSYIDGAMRYQTDYERANYLSEQLYADIRYERGDLDQSVASALLQKKTVCAGFSKAYSMLANAVGVDTVTLQSPEHAWNVTSIADHWYHDDVTNNLWFYSDQEMDEIDERLNKTRVTYSNGSSKVFGMHDLQREYYFDLYPECGQSYDGSSKLLSGEITITEPPTTLPPATEPTEAPTTLPPATEPTEPPTTLPPATEPTEPPTTKRPATEPTEPVTAPATDGETSYYMVDPVEAYYFAENTDLFDLRSLVSTLWYVEETWSSNSRSTSRTSVSNGVASLKFYNGLTTPAEVLAYVEEKWGDHYYYGALPVSYQGEQVNIHDILVVRRGDFDCNGVTNAVDASGVLNYAAAYGAGNTPELPEDVNEKVPLFAAKLTEDGTALTAADAAEILILSAKLGAGEVG